MPRIALELLTLPSAVGTIPARPQAAGSEASGQKVLREKLQSRLEGLRAKAEFPGISVGFGLKDGRSAGVAVGYAGLENKVSLTPTDRLLAGSVGKIFVAVPVLQLVEEGKVGLDDPVSKWLGQEPWFDRLPNAKVMTVRSGKPLAGAVCLQSPPDLNG